jgi:hypothetical protein
MDGDAVAARDGAAAIAARRHRRCGRRFFMMSIPDLTEIRDPMISDGRCWKSGHFAGCRVKLHNRFCSQLYHREYPLSSESGGVNP